MEGFIQTVMTWITSVGIKILISFVILIVLFRIINKIAARISKSLENNGKLDKTLAKTLTYVAAISLKILVVITLVGYLGIETSGLSAVIASLGVCVGLAVNGTLSNLAGGVMLLITRPFRLEDYISAQGYEGSVEDIRICYTKIKTIDNKVVYLPNSALSTGTIVNYSEEGLRRVDLDFSIGSNDPVKVRSVLLNVCDREPLILKSPATEAPITDYGAGKGVKITLRAWCKSSDYWEAYYNILEGAQRAFSEAEIVVPFNQLDVHIKQ